MSTTAIAVSNSSELKNALSNASGGETIVLKDGYYGDLYISNEKYNSTVTIVAENTLGADFGKINITNGENISIQGVDANDFKVYDSSHIAIKDSHTKIYFSNVYHADIDNNEVDGGYNGITLNDVRHFSVTNNYVHHVQSDLLRVTGDSYDGLIDNNILFDAMPVRYSDGSVDHADAIQFFAYGGSTPHDIVISRNLIVDDRDTGAIYTQGIFLSDPSSGGYQNILIEDNLISVGSPNSIYINGGQKNVVVRNNSLIPNEDGGGSIILAEKSGNNNSGTTVTGNIAKILTDETKSSNIGDNYFYGRDYDISKLFQGDGDTWQDYLPVEGSLAKHYGALDYLNDLLSGNVETRTLSGTSTPDSPGQPDPQPQPEPETDTSDGSSSYTPADGTVVFALEGETNFNGNSNSVVNVAHSSDWEVGNGIISFGFSANDLNGRQGLFSKDANQFSGGGNHIAVWLEGSVLYARFQSDSEEAKFSLGNIKTGQLYAVELQFGDNGVAAYVNGTLIGSKDLNINFEDNNEYAQIGGLGWSSNAGSSAYGNAFNGKIYDLEISQLSDGSNRFWGNSNSNHISGGTGNDTIRGGDGDDDIDGGEGADVLFGGEGADTLIGGAGGDRVQYSDATSWVTADLSNAANNTGEAAGDTYDSIEHLYGSNHSDSLRGNSIGNWIWGDSGNDTLRGWGGNDRLDGGDGADVLFGGEGADTLIGGAGGDRVQYSDATSWVTADLSNAANNTGEAAGDTYDSIEHLYGSIHSDSLRGNSVGNWIWGGSGNDTLRGWGGNDRLDGGEGADVLIGGEGADTLIGGAGGDRAQYSDATSGVTADLANSANNTGEAAGDTYDSIEHLYGTSYSDSLRGDSGGNWLWGASGDDHIVGREGNDLLSGGEGADTFEFGSGDGRDVISDFSVGEDELYFTSGLSVSSSHEANVFGGSELDTILTLNSGDVIVLSDLSGISVVDLFG
ncbi:MAG: right-handed parallel beta-helix repeat-containing protein [Roseibium sp.]|uniref:hypothetical protein n=1 Tax=Roseibium sp. TaxID=1936156 RepID=UPI003D9C262E